MNAAPIAPAVNDDIQKLLKERLGRYGFERAMVNAGSDHSGDPALFIDAYYRLSGEPVKTIEILHLLSDLRNLLVHSGESRFPYLKHHFDEKQQVRTRKQK
jgi:hypothetical protein